MAWRREGRVGMFVHWGLFSIPAGQWKGQRVGGPGEWVQFAARIPPCEYGPLVQQFNPTAFDARRWADLARRAGMKYLVVTAKHHDGFCLFDSKLTDYQVMNTPCKRDLLKELSQACRDQGIKIGWHYSILAGAIPTTCRAAAEARGLGTTGPLPGSASTAISTTSRAS